MDKVYSGDVLRTNGGGWKDHSSSSIHCSRIRILRLLHKIHQQYLLHNVTQFNSSVILLLVILLTDYHFKIEGLDITRLFPATISWKWSHRVTNITPRRATVSGSAVEEIKASYCAYEYVSFKLVIFQESYRDLTISTLAEGAGNTTVRVCAIGLSINHLIRPIYFNTQWIASTCRGRSFVIQLDCRDRHYHGSIHKNKEEDSGLNSTEEKEIVELFIK